MKSKTIKIILIVTSPSFFLNICLVLLYFITSTPKCFTLAAATIRAELRAILRNKISKTLQFLCRFVNSAHDGQVCTKLWQNSDIFSYDLMVGYEYMIILVTTFTLLSLRQSMRENSISVGFAGFHELDVANLPTAKRNSLGNNLLVVSTGRCRRQRRYGIDGDGS